MLVVSVAIAVSRPRVGRRSRRWWRRRWWRRRRRRRRLRRLRWRRRRRLRRLRWRRWRGRRRRRRVMRRCGRWTTVRSRRRRGRRNPRDRRGRARTASRRGGRSVRPIRVALGRGLRSHRRLNHDPVRPQTERNAKGPCRTREKARDQRAAGGSNREQERCDYPLRPFHPFPVPALLGIELPVLLPQFGCRNLRRYPRKQALSNRSLE